MAQTVDPIEITELSFDQLRERVNTAQRFTAWRDAQARAAGFRGSLVWHRSNGEDYLTRSYYDAAGIRRQKVEGRRGPDTERVKAEWEKGRAEAQARAKRLRATLERQAAVNRALGLGRMPLLGARIVRALDDAGLLGNGLRIVGANALYAYEAAAGVMLDAGITATLDIDLLFDARRRLRMLATADVPEGTLIALLRRLDRSFARGRETFRATNADGYLVDLIKPLRVEPWRAERERLGDAADEIAAVPVAGLAWLESAPAFEAIAIDEKGLPLRLATIDPRVFAAHKLWLSARLDRDPVRRRRDAAQAAAVGSLVAQHLPQLPYEANALRMLPRAVFEAAVPLFLAREPNDAQGF
jgi:hypothetical protein